jgi:integrase
MLTSEAVMVRGGLLNGLRRCEVLRITVQDAQNALRSGILVVRGKSMKYREIPVHLGFADALRAHFEKNPSKVETEPLLGFARSRSEKILKDFCDRFGKKFSFHTLRRSFGRNAWLNGVHLETIAELYGHASCDQTRWYLGLNLTDMRQALTQIGCKSELKVIDELPQRRIAPARAIREENIPKTTKTLNTPQVDYGIVNP